ncbi:UNVERIFIED_CONTAM: hypothetical protein Scaly_1087300 [Sesamum calycinum]|uniref:Uncharacterized protein n=1 Tax=Sesamum calycinum TaxID=2727403 RepID=A0AAW2QLI4_9LAMI
MMSYRRSCVVLVVLVIYVACMNNLHVEATRVLPEDFSTKGFPESNHLVTFPAVYQNARETMSYWLQRLASGPSLEGPVIESDRLTVAVKP